MSYAYHSALHKPLPSVPAAESQALPKGSQALVHNVWDSPPLPSAFDCCDVLYGDPPWPRGYDEFNARASVKAPRPYPDFARQLDRIARSVTAPLVYVIGKSCLRYFSPDSTAKILLHDYESLAAGYRIELPKVETAEELLHRLAETYSCVGDFLAGYGKAGCIFAEHGKSFVLGDFNAECVGFIASQAPGWFA